LRDWGCWLDGEHCSFSEESNRLIDTAVADTSHKSIPGAYAAADDHDVLEVRIAHLHCRHWRSLDTARAFKAQQDVTIEDSSSYKLFREASFRSANPLSARFPVNSHDQEQHCFQFCSRCFELEHESKWLAENVKQSVNIFIFNPSPHRIPRPPP
jgi:hypothetical protein